MSDGAEAIRRLAERQLAALVAGMDDAVTVRDAEGRLVLANRAALELAGAASVEELRGMPREQLWERYALYDGDGRPLGDRDLAWMRALDGEEAPPPILMRRVDRATGRQNWLRSKVVVVP